MSCFKSPPVTIVLLCLLLWFVTAILYLGNVCWTCIALHHWLSSLLKIKEQYTWYVKQTVMTSPYSSISLLDVGHTTNSSYLQYKLPTSSFYFIHILYLNKFILFKCIWFNSVYLISLYLFDLNHFILFKSIYRQQRTTRYNTFYRSRFISYSAFL